MTASELLKLAINKKVSDVFIVSGCPVSAKIGGRVEPLSEHRLSPEDTQTIIHEIYTLDHQREMDRLLRHGDDDFSFSVSGLGRFRCNAYKQRGSLSAVLRVVSFSLPDPDMLSIPPAVIDLYRKQRGLRLDHRSGGKRKIHHPGLYD